MTTPDIYPTAVYALGILVAAIAALELSGFFPAEARPEVLRRASATALIGLLGVTSTTLAAAALWTGIHTLPWPAVIIAGGLALLLAPLGFELAPRGFWDSQRGIACTVVVTSAVLAVLVQFNT